MANLVLDGFEVFEPKSRASLKASSWEMEFQELDTTTGPQGQNWQNKAFTIVGNGEEDAEGNVELANVGINLLGSSLATGDRSDTFVGAGEFGGVVLRNSTLVETGNGNDAINGEGGFVGVLVVEDSSLNMDGGNDTINGEGGFSGVASAFGSEISMGDGNDTINGEGGSYGVDLFAFDFIESNLIDMGGGNDAIIGVGGDGGVRVLFGSEIKMGSGNDSVDALVGGFVGDGIIEDVDGDGFPTVTFTGFINFDEGDDTLIGGGFGSGITFNGGVGEDKVVLGDGTYTYGDDDDGFGPYLSDGSDRMSIVDFELIAGINGTIDQFGNEYQTGDADLVNGEYVIVNGFLKVEVIA